MLKRYRIQLSAEERQELHHVLAAGTAAARTLTHARILLKADEGAGGPHWTDAQIADAIEVDSTTVERVRRRCVEDGLAAALRPRPSPQLRLRKLDGAAEAHLVALACSPAPTGQQRWTMTLLADKLVELALVDAISDETVRRTLKKTRSSRG